MTIAVAEAFICYNSLTEAERRTDSEEGYAELKRLLVDSMHRIGRRYPDCGYGGRFYYWIMENRTEPYKSYGNGSAMRVSPVIWYANSLEEAEGSSCTCIKTSLLRAKYGIHQKYGILILAAEC